MQGGCRERFLEGKFPGNLVFPFFTRIEINMGRIGTEQISDVTNFAFSPVKYLRPTLGPTCGWRGG